MKAATSSYSKRNYEKSRWSRQKKRALSQEYYSAHKKERKASMRNYNTKHEKKLQEASRKYYSCNSGDRKATFSKYYITHKEARKKAYMSYYRHKSKERKITFKNYYEKSKDKIKEHYSMNKSKVLASACAYKQLNAKKILKRARVYHAKNRYRRCTDMQRRHELAEPKTYTQDMYIVQLIGKILSAAEVVVVVVSIITIFFLQTA